MANADTSLVRSLQRGLHIINVVAVRGPLHAKPVARAVGLSLPTTYHLLRTLVHAGYLSRLADGTYVLGERLSQHDYALAASGSRPLTSVGDGD